MSHTYLQFASQVLAGLLGIAYYLSFIMLLGAINPNYPQLPIIGAIGSLLVAISIGPMKDTLTYLMGRDTRSAQLTPHDRNLLKRERKRIARDLHDRVLQLLHHTVIQISNEPLTDIEKNLQEAISETRQICLSLRSLPHPLNEAINRLVSRIIPEHEVTCVINLSEAQLTSEMENCIYFIVQEALTNIKRHAQAKQAEIRLELAHEKIYLFIQDDGRGFDPTQVTKQQLGLIGIQERVSNLGGTYEFETSVGCGTAHWIYIPLNQSSSFSIEQ